MSLRKWLKLRLAWTRNLPAQFRSSCFFSIVTKISKFDNKRKFDILIDRICKNGKVNALAQIKRFIDFLKNTCSYDCSLFFTVHLLPNELDTLKLTNKWLKKCVKIVPTWSFSGPYFPAFGFRTNSITNWMLQFNLQFHTFAVFIMNISESV